MTRRQPPTLVRRLALRMALVAAASVVALFGFFLVRYLHSREELSQHTLEAAAVAIGAAIADDADPTTWPLYRNHPDAYAFRAFDTSLPSGRQLLIEANAKLLPPLPAARPGEPDPIRRLRERFEALPLPNGQRTSNRWMLTDWQSIQARGIWVQVAMIGDPAWTMRAALEQEIFDHVVLPAGVLVPTMTLAMLLVIRRALRPLTRIAEATRTLSLAAARGTPLAPLPEDGLTRELRVLVRVVNALLGTLDATLTRQRAFAADAAHELRTPLAVLRLQVAELPKGPVTERLDEELAALAHLVGQLLRFAQADEVMATERHAFDVATVARLTCEDMAPAALARQHELAFVAPEQPVILTGNPALLAVALRNLVENALRASPSGSTVTVSVTPVGLTVEDSGPGVLDANKAKIFDRLWQADRRREGAGIGLALVRRIAQLHEGAVWVEDRPGGGARFVLRLTPLPEAPA
jgi:signal transduction histidine kinase